MKNPMKALLQVMAERRKSQEQAQLEVMRIERDQARREVRCLTQRLLLEMDDNEQLRQNYGDLVQARLRDAALGARIATARDFAGIA